MKARSHLNLGPSTAGAAIALAVSTLSAPAQMPPREVSARTIPVPRPSARKCTSWSQRAAHPAYGTTTITTCFADGAIVGRILKVRDLDRLYVVHPAAIPIEAEPTGAARWLS